MQEKNPPRGPSTPKSPHTHLNKALYRWRTRYSLSFIASHELYGVKEGPANILLLQAKGR